jgi:hypothetical protein
MKEPEMKHIDYGSERGIALPLALVILIALGFSATAAVFMSNTEMKISSSFSTANSAIAAAEAAADHGVATLNTLSRAGQDPDSVQILSDSLGRFAYAVVAYSKREGDVLPSGFDFNGDGDKIDVVLYDQSFGYAGASATGAPGDEGFPVKYLLAVATDGRNNARVRVEVAKDRLQADLDSPFSLSAPSDVELNGSFDVDGRLYDRDGNLVPSSTLTPPYGATAASKAAAKDVCNYWKPAIKLPAEGDLDLDGSMDSFGHVSFDHGDDDDKQNYNAEDSLATFKFTPEELLGVEPEALDQYKKDASEVPDFLNLSGVNYVTSGSVPSQISGSGILIVHNPNFDVKKYDCVHFPTTCEIGYSLDPANQPLPLKINANGKFNGIIITDELIRLNGTFEMLGALVSLTTLDMNIPANGSGYVRWSCEAVIDAIQTASGYSVDLSWSHQLE